MATVLLDKPIVPSHDEVRRLLEVIHYEEHPARVESAEFRRNKELLHQKIQSGEIPACHINNGCCEGQTEIHHFHIEYSAWNGVDEAKVLKELGITNADQFPNLTPICHKHHMGIGTGIHFITYPAWILQKFLNPKALGLFEAAVKELKYRKPEHEDKNHNDHHYVNRLAKVALFHLAAA